MSKSTNSRRVILSAAVQRDNGAVPPPPKSLKLAKPGKAMKPAKAARPRAKAPAGRPGTKLALLTGLLRRKGGATFADAVKATGWQAHSVRGAISGALKKKRGLAVASATVEGRGRVYRIAG